MKVRYKRAQTDNLCKMYSWKKDLEKEKAQNKAHLAQKKKAGLKRRQTIWGQTCEYMCMISDRPKPESEEEKNVRLLDRKTHRLNTYKK